MSLEPTLDNIKKRFEEGNIDSALLDLQSAEEIKSRDFRIFFYYGRCYIKKEEFKKAVNYLEKAFNLNPIGYIAFYLAKAYLLNDQFSKAVEYIDDALQLHISERVQAGLNYFKAGGLLELGNKEESLKAAQKAVDLKPENQEYQKVLHQLQNI